MAGVLKNTAYLTGSFVMQKIISFIYFTLVARIVGVSNLGIYSFATSYTGIFSILVDFGLSSYLIKKIAQGESASKILNKVLNLKAILGVLTFILAISIIWFWEKDSMVLIMVFLSGLLMVLDSLLLSVWGVFRGCQNLKYEAIGVVIGQFLIMVVGLGGLLLGVPLFILIIALILGSLFQLVFSGFLLKSRFMFAFCPGITVSQGKELFLSALPFGLLGIFSKLYLSMDSILLKFFGGSLGNIAVGLYSVPFKVNMALQVIPSAFAAAIYPAMSAYFVSDKLALRNLFEKSLKYLMMLGLPASVGIIVLAPDIITKIYGVDFISAILPLQIVISSLAFSFMGFPVGALLNSSSLQKKNTLNLGIVAVFNLVLNLILIPKYSYLGASVVAALSNVYLFFGGLYYCEKILDFSKKIIFLNFLKYLIASIIMGFLVYFLKNISLVFNFSNLELNLYLLIGLPILGGIIYLGELFIIGDFNFKEIKGMIKK